MAYELTATARDIALVREGPTAYRITGIVTATSTGWKVDAYPLNEGISPPPESARWLLHAVPPGEGDAVNLVITDIPVDVPFEDAAELKTVFVHLQGATTEDGSDDLTLTID